jgi:hypothetical protein
MQKIHKKIEQVIHLCVLNDEQRQKWLQTMGLYKTMMAKTVRKEDMTDNEIDQFQLVADDFFVAWNDLLGYDGCTNYIHMISAGHFCHYLLK